MIDNTYNRFMMQSVEGRGGAIVDSDEETCGDDNPLFGRINGAPRYVIAIHVTPAKKSRKKRDGTETRYLLQGQCKVFLKKTSQKCSDCAESDVIKNEMCYCQPKTNRSFFAQHVHSTHDLLCQIY